MPAAARRLLALLLLSASNIVGTAQASLLLPSQNGTTPSRTPVSGSSARPIAPASISLRLR